MKTQSGNPESTNIQLALPSGSLHSLQRDAWDWMEQHRKYDNQSSLDINTPLPGEKMLVLNFDSSATARFYLITLGERIGGLINLIIDGTQYKPSQVSSYAIGTLPIKILARKAITLQLIA